MVLGIFGDPVGHSLSPLMQNAALGEAGIDAIYVPFHVTPEQLPQAVSGLRAMQVRGINVTIPHKEAICPLLDELNEDAALIGAVNTVVLRQGRLIGYNTDGGGLVASLQEEIAFSPAGKQVLLLGAGGATRAAAVALARAGAQSIVFANRTRERADELVADFSGKLPGTAFAVTETGVTQLAAAVASSDLVVNTTSIGLHGDDYPQFPWTAVAPGTCFYDIVYRQGSTPWLTRARELGHPAADGLGMLAAQGELAYSIWIGQAPPSGVMKCRLLATVAAS